LWAPPRAEQAIALGALSRLAVRRSPEVAALGNPTAAGNFTGSRKVPGGQGKTFSRRREKLTAVTWPQDRPRGTAQRHGLRRRGHGWCGALWMQHTGCTQHPGSFPQLRLAEGRSGHADHGQGFGNNGGTVDIEGSRPQGESSPAQAQRTGGFRESVGLIHAERAEGKPGCRFGSHEQTLGTGPAGQWEPTETDFALLRLSPLLFPAPNASVRY
jgi:hypothetical protein